MRGFDSLGQRSWAWVEMVVFKCIALTFLPVPEMLNCLEFKTTLDLRHSTSYGQTLIVIKGISSNFLWSPHLASHIFRYTMMDMTVISFYRYLAGSAPRSFSVELWSWSFALTCLLWVKKSPDIATLEPSDISLCILHPIGSPRVPRRVVSWVKKMNLKQYIWQPTLAT